MKSLLQKERQKFHRELLRTHLTVDDKGIPSIADKHQKTSIIIAKKIVKKIGTAKMKSKAAGQSAGDNFEKLCAKFLSNTFSNLSALRPGNWEIEKIGKRQGIAIAGFEQYSHLLDLSKIAETNKEFAAALGNDYSISPDILILRHPEEDAVINGRNKFVDKKLALKTPIRKFNNDIPIIRASISCKWTLRSDRAQNARSEALNLIRNRKGRVPHIAVITAEPTPSRISSLALGTGDIDCVYHFALHELVESVKEIDNDEAEQLLNIMIDGKRLKDISDLPLDLAI